MGIGGSHIQAHDRIMVAGPALSEPPTTNKKTADHQGLHEKHGANNPHLDPMKQTEDDELTLNETSTEGSIKKDDG
ncbi:hypothetical protein AA0119_g13575 [Alternaria tenuissima]|uniref:Uncharacterized protein n=1 Tax=Alternaria tenuissima TaxID=119927 RepID=A0ABY0FNA3_9PLEO|nr:hypothetical protein AA0119_g13575 [Alternaria tenuissima]